MGSVFLDFYVSLICCCCLLLLCVILSQQNMYVALMLAHAGLNLDLMIACTILTYIVVPLSA